MPTQPSSSAHLRYAVQLLALATAYVALGTLGLTIAPISTFATLVWLPTGLSLAALVIGGYRFWPAVMIGALVANLLVGAPLLVACGMAAGNTLEAVVATFALRRIPAFRGSLERFTEALGLVALAGVLSTVVSATVGVSSLVLHGMVAAPDFARTWLAWWTGDLMSDLLVAPVILTWALGPPVRLRPAALAEAGVLGAVLVAGSVLLFLVQRPETEMEVPILRTYLLFLPLIWAAVRFGVRGSVTAMFAVAVIAVYGTYTGHGAFAHADRARGLIALHVFLGSVSLASLALGSVVSEHKRSREELSESESALRGVIGGAADAIYVKDWHGRYMILNAASARLLKLPLEAAIGKDAAALLPGADVAVIHDHDEEVLRTGQPTTTEETLTIGGTAYVFQSTRAPYRDRAGNVLGVIGVSRDITERAREQRERDELLAREQQARAEAQAATRAKDEFLAVLSHELRTPLQSMLGWTQMLKARPLDPMMQKGLGIIERNVKAQAQLIEDLLDVSRIVAGKLRMERKQVDLARVVETALETAKTAAVAKAIRLDATLEPVHGEVVGDPDRLRQVVSNLLSNAVKFTPSGGRVGVRLTRDGDAGLIVVEDAGRGISPAFLPHVFERFRQAESTSMRSHGGLGLGLAIVRHIVERHGGTVEAESPGEGRGSRFTVTLPLGRVEPRAVAAERVAHDGPTTPVMLEGVRVLVVDDDPDACELLETALHAAGAEVHTAPSVRAALEELASFRPDLMISDIGMPEEDGYSLVRRVRERESAEGGHLPIVALTAFASPSDREEALASGFDAYLAKPASPGDIVRTTAGLVNQVP